MFVWHMDPVAVHLGFVEIRWYGIIYALAFLIGYWYTKRAAKERGWSLDVDALFTFLIIGTVVGARLFEVLFYNFGYYSTHLFDVVAVWKGGLSFHGGLVGGFLAAWWFCKKHKFSLVALADVLVIPLAFGLFLGRLANFINGELYGFPTSLPWGVDFGDGLFRHPTQIYESLKNLFIFGVLVLLKKRYKEQHFKGYLFMMFFTLYGVLRFGIEFLKVPEVSWLFLTVGQWFSAAMAVIGISGLYYVYKRKNR